MTGDFKKKSIRLSSAHLIPCSFLAAILCGTLLLMLPWATAQWDHTDFLTALFTATTSVCVTGLVVADTYSHWSLFGQIVILLLVQIGGLGIIAVTSLFLLWRGDKMSLGGRVLLKDALNLEQDVNPVRFLIRLFQGTILVEAAGAVLYTFAFVPEYGAGKGIWASIFNAVSAFCNAGMDVMGADSLAGWRQNPLVMAVTMLLIVLGGLGYVVWFDLLKGVRSGISRRFTPVQMWKRLSEHTKLVLCMTVGLLAAGTVFFFLAEFHNPDTIGGMSLQDKLVNSLFQSVTLRTAGFTTIPQEKLTGLSCLAAYIFMFIGGSPIGTAGGVKTVTIFLVILNVVSYIRDQDATILFRRKISEEIMRKAAAVVFVGLATVFLLTMALMAVEHVELTDALYEVVSASATVGLTRGLTPSLNAYGRLVVILAMYLGRIGPISMAIFFTGRREKNHKITYADGKFYVG